MLSAHGLTCLRGTRRLFAGLDVAVEPGQCLHVRGDNGSGKTSLLRILAGLSPPEEGAVQWRGEFISESAQAYRQQLLYLGHQGALEEELTALENLRFASLLDGVPLVEMDAMAALARFGLRGREDLSVRRMSAGQKRRVLLARLLTRKASLWVLDEPFTALDTSAVALLTELIREHVSNGGMAVLTSHQALDMPSARELQL